MNYHFYGWENAVAQPLHKEYEKIKSPRELYDILSGLWCADTCAPRMRHEWTKENKTKGQCSITALTSEQFLDRAGELVYENNPEQFREVHFAKEEKRLWYEQLRAGLHRVLEE